MNNKNNHKQYLVLPLHGVLKAAFIALGMTIVGQSGMAWGKDVRGRVTDAATGKPLAGVRVQAYGDETKTAMTDAKGEYRIDLPDYVSSLYLTLEGQQPLQVPVGKDGQVDVRMYPAVFSNAYQASTQGAYSVSATDFDNNVETSVDPLLKLQLAGDVRMVSRGGSDGVGNAMFIGGLNSLSANAQPLVVVDGVIMDMQYDRSMLHSGYYNNLLANIDVDDISQVEVLKNGTALYGAKGANGVIAITTKRSRSMATRIDVNIGGRFQTVPHTSSVLGANDYRTYVTEMLSSEMSNISSLKFLVADPTYYYYPMYHSNTDWKKEVYHQAFAQNYGINVQGGDNVAQYNLSVGYTAADGVLRNNDFSRFSMRMNTDINVIQRLNVRFDASYSDVTRNLRDLGVPQDVESSTITSPNFLALIKSPFLSPYAYDLNGRQSSYLSEADDYLENIISTSDRSLANPVSILVNGDGRNRNDFGNRLVMFTLTPKYDICKGLFIQEQFNFTLVNTNENYYLPISGVPRFRLPGFQDQLYVDNMVQSLTARQNAIQSDTRIDWRHRFNAHALHVFGGVRYFSNRYKLNVQKGYNTGNDKTPNMSGSLVYKSTDGADDKYNDIAWYANADYNYAERYYLTAMLSAQASSRFGNDADGLKAFGTVWGIFPSLQASWVMSNERWMRVPGVNYLRLNLGYDVSGNDDVDYTASRSYFVAKRMLGSTIDGLLLGNVGNSNLRWETTRRFTAGLETRLLDNRLYLRFDAYKSWTDNLLTLKNMAWTSGLKQGLINGGKLENSGFDVSLSYKVLNTHHWQWELGGSMGHYSNKVTSLDNNSGRMLTQIYGATVLTAVDHPAGLFYGYRTKGVLASQEEADQAALYQLDKSGGKVAFQAGDVRFDDIDGNHVIDDADRVVIGDPNPDVYGHIYSQLSFKRWTLAATFNYCLGNDVFNYERSILESGKYFYNQTTAINRRWTTEGQVTDVPRISYQDPHGNARFSDRWIEDGSYLRLSNVSLSYQLPLQSTFIQGVTIWGSAQNLFTITRYLGSDPDCALSGSVLAQGIDCGLPGRGRSFSMGVRINL